MTPPRGNENPSFFHFEMKINSKALPFTLAFAAQRSVRTSLRLAPLCIAPDPAPFARTNGHERLRQIDSDVSTSSNPEQLAIYAVDDKPLLTELYTGLLEAAGYLVKTFNDRIKALAALKGEKKPPNLLITD